MNLDDIINECQKPKEEANHKPLTLFAFMENDQIKRIKEKYAYLLKQQYPKNNFVVKDCRFRCFPLQEIQDEPPTPPITDGPRTDGAEGKEASPAPVAGQKSLHD